MRNELLRKRRDAVIRYIYDNGAGRTGFNVPVDQIMSALRLSKGEFSEVSKLMRSQGMVESYSGVVGSIGLSITGQDEAEGLGPDVSLRALRPGAVTVNASYSVVQVAAPGSVQSAQAAFNQTNIEQLLDRIETDLPHLELAEAERTEAEGLVASLRESVFKKLPASAARAIGAALTSILTSAGSTLGQQLMALLKIQ